MVMVRLGKPARGARKRKRAQRQCRQQALRGGSASSSFSLPSNPVAVRNLDHAGAPRKLLDQRIGGGAVVRVEVGVPFVEQIDRRVGVAHDFLQARATAARRTRSRAWSRSAASDRRPRRSRPRPAPARTGTRAGRRSASNRRGSSPSAFRLVSSVDLPEPLAPRTLMRPVGCARIRLIASSSERDRAGVAALAQHQPVELHARVEIRIGLRMHVVGDAAQPRPVRQQIVPAGGERDARRASSRSAAAGWRRARSAPPCRRHCGRRSRPSPRTRWRGR